MERSLGQRVGEAGPLGKSVPIGFFFQGQRCVFRIGTTRSGTDEFLGAAFPRVMQNKRPHHQILIKELRRPFLIWQISANKSRQMKHDLGRMLVKQPSSLSFLAQIIFPVADYKRILAPDRAKLLKQMCTEKPSSPRN